MGLSEYGVQLREKQKIKRTYGLLEKQFRKYYDMASRMQGNTGNLLSSLLERRLDNIIYRFGLASSRNQARQLVNHGYFLINGKKVDIASCLIKGGDVVSVKKGKENYFGNIKNALKDHQTPSWLVLDYQKLQGKIVALPAINEIDINVDIHLVVEFYSKR